MPLITALKPQKGKRRVNVFLDGKFSFGIDIENMIKFGLKVEKDLSEKEIEKIARESEYQKNLDRLLRFTTMRPRSEKEIENYFMRKKMPEVLRESLFNRLKKLGFINDYEFAKWWIEQRKIFKPKGSKVLVYELRKKGISREIAEGILEKEPEEEEALARRVFEKVKRKYVGMDRYKVRKKLYEYMARRGFNWEIVKKILGSMDEEF